MNVRVGIITTNKISNAKLLIHYADNTINKMVHALAAIKDMY